MDLTEKYALDLDLNDPLVRFRDEFRNADQETIYLDGNSLGRLPLATMQRLEQVISIEWGDHLIGSWKEGWMDLSDRLGEKIAKLIGARPGEVLVCDATSINLFKLVLAALRYQKGRSKLISDELNFPSDLYVLQGVMDMMGPPYELVILKSDDSMSIDPESIHTAMDDETALLTFTHTNFRSSYVMDMESVTHLAHDHGAMILWDLSHSVGAIPVKLNDCNVDLAIGCTYKYLNGGPGSSAFLYVRKDLQEKLQQPIWGWLGSEDPFTFGREYKPASDIHRFLVGTPPVLSMSALEPGLDLHLEAGMEALREKSIRQTEYMIFLIDAWLAPLGFGLRSPRDSARRGSHVAIHHSEADKITRSLIQSNGLKVIPDYRPPDLIRLGIAPIYNSFVDIYRGIQRIREVTGSGKYLEH